MNVKNNKRRLQSREKIEKAFLNIILEKSIKQITVTEICKKCKLNRSTFYANYIDIYDLADTICKKIENDFKQEFLFIENHTALSMFKFIYDNQIMFKIYFMLGYDKEYQTEFYDIERAKQDFDDKYVDYHIEFFRNGFTAIVKKWLNDGCKQTPEEMTEILKSEYARR